MLVVPQENCGRAFWQRIHQGADRTGRGRSVQVTRRAHAHALLHLRPMREYDTLPRFGASFTVTSPDEGEAPLLRAGLNMSQSIKLIREILRAWHRAGAQSIEWPVCDACHGYREKGPREPVCRVCKGTGRTFPGFWWRLQKAWKRFWIS
jgi:hypothetical protein